MLVEIRSQGFNPWREVENYQDAQLTKNRYGATCVFTGTMRDFHQGQTIESMTLEYYPGMTEKQLQKLVQASVVAHQLLDALVIHRVGTILPNDTIVAVATWSGHRKAAFESCREIMEALKSKAPFWKQEQTDTGSRWVEKNTEGY